MNSSLSFVRKYGPKLVRSISSLKGYDLKNYRSLLSIKGPDAPVFLQNLITNDIYQLNTNETRPAPKSIFAMVLNNRGRVLYDVLVHLIDSSPASKEYLVEIDSSLVKECISRHLVPLKLRKRVEISQVDGNYKLFHVIGDDTGEFGDKSRIVVVEADPRYAGLGYRVIVKTKDPNSKISEYFKNVVDDEKIENYKEWLYKNGVGENREDVGSANAIPLEYNLVFLNGVSFDKGCYLGQELVAKTHHTGVIRKRLMPLKIVNPGKQVNFNPGAEIINKNGKVAGKLINFRGEYGIGMLRLEHVDRDMVVLDADKNEINVRTEIPKYWRPDDANVKALIETFDK